MDGQYHCLLLLLSLLCCCMAVLSVDNNFPVGANKLISQSISTQTLHHSNSTFYLFDHVCLLSSSVFFSLLCITDCRFEGAQLQLQKCCAVFVCVLCFSTTLALLSYSTYPQPPSLSRPSAAVAKATHYQEAPSCVCVCDHSFISTHKPLLCMFVF